MLNELTTVLIAGFDPGCGQHVLESLHDDESVQLVGVLDNPSEAIQYAISTPPDVVVVCGKDSNSWREICSFVCLAVPQSRIILVCREPDPETLSAAMMLGVRQVLAYDTLGDTMLPTIRRLQEMEEVKGSEEYMSATDPMKHPRLISLSGAKGGVGKTTLSVNLAVALAQLNAGSVVIWDAYKQFGDVASVMGVTATRTLAELIDLGDELDEELILNHTVRHDSGAHVLITSDRPLPLDAMGDRTVEKVMMALRKRYRFIVVDTPPMLCSSDVLIFSRSWLLLLVTTLRDVTAVSDALKLIDVLEPRYVRADVISIILNRTSRTDSVKQNEVEKLIGKKVIAAVPEDPQVIEANNLGRPICQLNPRGNTTKAIQKLADTIVQSASTFKSA